MRANPDEGAGELPRQVDVSEAILHEILAGLEHGRRPDTAALRRRFPKHEATVERLCGAAAGYVSLRASLRQPGATSELLAPGCVLGDFEIEAPIGRGGMGVVYRARQRSLGGRAVALKVQALGEVPERTRKRFQREALTAATLHHPHLAEVYGFGTQGEHLYYAMQLVEGPSLRHELDVLAAHPELRGRDEHVRRVVAQLRGVAAALDVVHRAGLVHRDVKPSNILLARRATDDELVSSAPAVLVDFGLVRPVEQHTRTELGGAAATPSYASPEQLLDLEVDARSDVFSLGATLHDLIAARMPSDRAQAAHGLEPLRELVPSIDADLAAIVAKATELDARWRYADAGALLEDLDRWLAREPVRARRAPARERVRRWLQRNPARVVRWTAIGLLLALVGWSAAQWRQFAHLRSLASEGLERGDVVAVVSALRELPRLPARLLLREPELARLLPRVADPDDAVVRAHDAFQRGAADQALLIAATQLRIGDVERERLLVQLLAAALDGPTANDTAASDARRVATVLSSRMFVDRPELGDRESPVGSRLRGPLARVAADPAAERYERLHALLALGACGTPACLPGVLDWAASHPTTSEETRSALMAVECIVRRALASGAHDELPFELAWRSVSNHFVQLDALRRDGRPIEQMEHEVDIAATRARHALILAQRASRFAAALPSAVRAARPHPALDAEFDGSRSDVGALPLELALAGEPAPLRARLVRGLREVDPCWLSDAGDLGWASGASLDPALAALALEFVRVQAARDGADRVAEEARFHVHLRRGQEESAGLCAELAPDADTLLGAPASEYSPLITVLRRDPAPLAELVARYGAHDPSTLPSLGSWEFRATPTQVCGLASSVRAVEADWSAESGGYLRFGRFGRAEAVFEFTLSADDAFSWVDLCLWHQLGARPYYPFFGTVMLDLEIDGNPIGAISVPSIHPALTILRLPHALLSPGTHVVRLRQLETSTTTYRLLWLGLRAGSR
ncbi:MAG: serine/threonine protein kinase [Planctomycetota bacterium]|nr:MAG: serine/threonine protein kinase [Planctomycetota bacterium]